MGTLVRESKIEVDGPIMLTLAECERLDAILDAGQAQLERAFKIKVDSVVRTKTARLRADSTYRDLPEALSRRLADLPKEVANDLRSYRTDTRQIKLKLKSGSTLKLTRFDEVASHPELNADLVTEVEIKLVRGRTECEVEIRDSYADLRISVTPETGPAADKLYAELKNWSADITASLHVRLWKKYGHFIPAIAAVLVSILTFTTKTVIPGPGLKQEAEKLLANGLKPADQLRATEIALKLAAGWEASADRVAYPNWILPVAVLIYLAGIVHLFRPPTCIGIGLGRGRVDRWKHWIGAVTKVGPAFLFLGVLASIVASWIMH